MGWLLAIAGFWGLATIVVAFGVIFDRERAPVGSDLASLAHVPNRSAGAELDTVRVLVTHR